MSNEVRVSCLGVLLIATAAIAMIWFIAYLLAHWP